MSTHFYLSERHILIFQGVAAHRGNTITSFERCSTTDSSWEETKKVEISRSFRTVLSNKQNVRTVFFISRNPFGYSSESIQSQQSSQMDSNFIICHFNCVDSHYISIYLTVSYLSKFCQVGWGCRIQRLRLCGYDTKQSDGEVQVILEIWGMRSTPSLPLLPGAICPGLVAPHRALSMG